MQYRRPEVLDFVSKFSHLQDTTVCVNWMEGLGIAEAVWLDDLVNSCR